MLWWIAIFLVAAIVLAILGFVVIAGALAWIAKVLFILFLILLVVSLFLYWRNRRQRG